MTLWSLTWQFYLEMLVCSFSRINFAAGLNLHVAWDSLINHTINFLAMHFDDCAIVNPDMHGAMLNCLAQLVKRRAGMEVVQYNKAARHRLVCCGVNYCLPVISCGQY